MTFNAEQDADCGTAATGALDAEASGAFFCYGESCPPPRGAKKATGAPFALRLRRMVRNRVAIRRMRCPAHWSVDTSVPVKSRAESMLPTGKVAFLVWKFKRPIRQNPRTRQAITRRSARVVGDGVASSQVAAMKMISPAVAESNTPSMATQWACRWVLRLEPKRWMKATAPRPSAVCAFPSDRARSDTPSRWKGSAPRNCPY